MPVLLHADVTAPIVASFKYLYSELGYGFLESVYQKGMRLEIELRGLAVRQEARFDVVHRGVALGEYRADMVVENRVLVEVKATRALTTADERQLLNYLKVSGLEVGLILHFGPEPRVVRRILTRRSH